MAILRTYTPLLYRFKPFHWRVQGFLGIHIKLGWFLLTWDWTPTWIVQVDLGKNDSFPLDLYVSSKCWHRVISLPRRGTVQSAGYVFRMRNWDWNKPDPVRSPKIKPRNLEIKYLEPETPIKKHEINECFFKEPWIFILNSSWFEPRKIPSYFPLNPGCLIGILIVVHYNPHITE